MRTSRYWLAALLICAVPAGCTMQPSWWPVSPRKELLTARKTYSATVKTITILRNASTFTESEGKVIDESAKAALDMLNKWEAAIELKQPTDVLIAEWNAIILRLYTQLVNGERKAGQRE